MHTGLLRDSLIRLILIKNIIGRLHITLAGMLLSISLLEQRLSLRHCNSDTLSGNLFHIGKLQPLCKLLPASHKQRLSIDEHAIHIKQHCLDHTHLLPPAKKGQVYFGRFYLGFCGATNTSSPEQKRGWGENPIPSQSTRKVYLLVISRKASTCSDAWSAGADGPRRSGCRTRA